MSIQQLSLKRSAIIFGVPITIFAAVFLIINSSLFKSNPNDLAFALTFDLLLTSPLLYLLLIRKTKISNLTAIPLFVIGLIIGYKVLPSDYHDTLDFFKLWVIPIIELSVFSFVVFKISKIKKNLKSQKSLDFYDALIIATESEFPKKIATAISTEITGIYYAFFHWRKVEPKENEFTYHHNNGTPALFFVLILIVGIEVFAMHLWIANYSVVLAYILSALSVYSGFQLFAFGKSLSKRPYVVGAKSLKLKYGILSNAEIDYANIAEITPSALNTELDKETKTLSPIGLADTHNVLIKLKEKQQIKSLYGFKKEVKNLLIHVDLKTDFIEAIQEQMKSTSES